MLAACAELPELQQEMAGGAEGRGAEGRPGRLYLDLWRVRLGRHSSLYVEGSRLDEERAFALGEPYRSAWSRRRLLYRVSF